MSLSVWPTLTTLHLFSQDPSCSAKGCRCIHIRALPPPPPTPHRIWGGLRVLTQPLTYDQIFNDNFTKSRSVFVGKQRPSPSHWAVLSYPRWRQWFTPFPITSHAGAAVRPESSIRPVLASTVFQEFTLSVLANWASVKKW